MHIVFFTYEYPTQVNPAGGLANYLKKTGRELCNRGHRTTIFLLSENNKSWVDNGVYIEEIKTNYSSIKKYLKIPYFRILLRVYANIDIAWRLRTRLFKLLKKTSIDIIQIPLLPHSGAMGLFLLWRKPALLIGRLSYDTTMYMELNKYYKKSISFHITTLLERFQIKRLDGVFGPCHRIAKYVQEREGVQIKVIRTPLEQIEKEKFIILPEHYIPQQPFFLFFSQFELFKGFDIAVEACKSILRSYPNNSVLFIGTAHARNVSKWSNELINLTKTNNKQFLLLPHLQKKHLYPIIQQSIAVLMPARLDNYPNSCLEAQMLGTIVIGTHSSGLDEMVVSPTLSQPAF